MPLENKLASKNKAAVAAHAEIRRPRFDDEFIKTKSLQQVEEMAKAFDR